MATTKKAAKGRKRTLKVSDDKKTLKAQSQLVKTICNWTEMLERKVAFKKLRPVHQFMVSEVITTIETTVTENVKRYWATLEENGWVNIPRCDSKFDGLKETFNTFLEDADNGIYKHKTVADVKRFREEAETAKCQAFGLALRQLSDLSGNDDPWLHHRWVDKHSTYKVQMRSSFDQWLATQNKTAVVPRATKKRATAREKAKSYGL